MQQTIMLILILAAPMLLVAMVVGMAISIVQSVTQIQEATLTFVPKILLCLLTLVVVSPWMLSVYIDHTQKLFQSLTVIAHHRSI